MTKLEILAAQIETDKRVLLETLESEDYDVKEVQEISKRINKKMEKWGEEASKVIGRSLMARRHLLESLK